MQGGCGTAGATAPLARPPPPGPPSPAAHAAHTLGADAVFVGLAAGGPGLTAAGEDAGLEEWRGPAACARGAVRPDGYAILRLRGRRFGFFLEYDRGTERPAQHLAKLDAYYAYPETRGATPATTTASRPSCRPGHRRGAAPRRRRRRGRRGALCPLPLLLIVRVALPGRRRDETPILKGCLDRSGARPRALSAGPGRCRESASPVGRTRHSRPGTPRHGWCQAGARVTRYGARREARWPPRPHRTRQQKPSAQGHRAGRSPLRDRGGGGSPPRGPQVSGL